MNKAAQLKVKATIEDVSSEAFEDMAETDAKLSFQKQRMEDEIRMKLDRFAKELAQARKARR
ncbi:MAG: hypothetical protein RLZZ385_621 [Pseudomonadota bacterium]